MEHVPESANLLTGIVWKQATTKMSELLKLEWRLYPDDELRLRGDGSMLFLRTLS